MHDAGAKQHETLKCVTNTRPPCQSLIRSEEYELYFNLGLLLERHVSEGGAVNTLGGENHDEDVTT